MKRTSGLVIAALILTGCSATAIVTANENAVAPGTPPETTAPAATTPPKTDTTEPETPASASSFDAQAPSGLSTPTPADLSRPLQDVTVSTTSYALTLDEGSQWEIPFVIAVPEGWVFDPDRPGFSDGASSIELIASCAGACEIKWWSTALSADGQFFDEGRKLFPDDAARNGSGSSNDIDSFNAMSATNDDGSGVSLGAHTRHDVGRFVGCTATATTGSTPLDQLSKLCEAIEVDWSVAAASTPAYVITERLTEDAAAAVLDPAPGLARQTISVEGEGLVSIAIPPGSTVNEDGDEIKLAITESIFTDLELNATCDGICGPQDWGTKLQEIRNTIGRARLRLDLDNDSPIDGGWLLSGDKDDDYIVVVARWNDQSDHFFSCQASIDERDFGLIDDLLNMCLSAEPDWASW